MKGLHIAWFFVASVFLTVASVQTHRLSVYQQRDAEWTDQQKKLQAQKLIDDEKAQKKQEEQEAECTGILLRTFDSLNHWVFPPQCKYTTLSLKAYITNITSQGYCKTHTRSDAITLLDPLVTQANTNFSLCDMRITSHK